MVNFKLIISGIKKFRLYLWLPISFIVLFVSIPIYFNLGSYLSPYSVSVSSYTREDGITINAHKRRLPGSIAHDVQYSAKQFICSIFIFLGVLGTTIPIYLTINYYQYLYHLKNSSKFNKDLIKYAIENKLRLYFSYISNHGEASQRTVHPYFLKTHTDKGITKLYLVSHCYLRNDKRTFIVSKMTDMEITKPSIFSKIKEWYSH
jgi:WYL domain